MALHGQTEHCMLGYDVGHIAGMPRSLARLRSRRCYRIFAAHSGSTPLDRPETLVRLVRSTASKVSSSYSPKARNGRGTGIGEQAGERPEIPFASSITASRAVRSATSLRRTRGSAAA